jgi:hypothetical protein
VAPAGRVTEIGLRVGSDLDRELRAMSPSNRSAEQVIRGSRRVVKLTRVAGPDGASRRTLYFTFPGGQPRSSRAKCSFVAPQHVPEFEGDEGWFEVEEVWVKPWSFWRAIRPAEPD